MFKKGEGMSEIQWEKGRKNERESENKIEDRCMYIKPSIQGKQKKIESNASILPWASPPSHRSRDLSQVWNLLGKELKVGAKKK